MAAVIFGFCPECHAVLQENGSGHFEYCAIVQRQVDLLRLELDSMVSVPTQNDFDWSSMTVHAVERLRAPKTTPVPDAIVRLAQQSYEGVINPHKPDGEKLHVLRHEFDSTARAETFAKLMKKAGNFTTPSTSVVVVVDPDDLHTEQGRKRFREQTGSALSDEQLTDMGGRTIAWRTGVRRGKAAA